MIATHNRHTPSDVFRRIEIAASALRHQLFKVDRLARRDLRTISTHFLLVLMAARTPIRHQQLGYLDRIYLDHHALYNSHTSSQSVQHTHTLHCPSRALPTEITPDLKGFKSRLHLANNHSTIMNFIQTTNSLWSPSFDSIQTLARGLNSIWISESEFHSNFGQFGHQIVPILD